ncbi:MAG: hypothetical protein ABIL66_05310, partial [candidate division WOR-3 bacterium]
MNKKDYSILIISTIISLLGLAMIFSTGGLSYFIRQAIWLGIAVLICLMISRFSSRFWQTFALPIYIFTCILTLIVLVYASSYP